MDRINFLLVLECALLSFQGLTEQEIIKRWNLPPTIIKRGIKIAEELKKEVINGG